MLATRAGLPIAVRVVPGNTSDPAAFIQIASEIHALSGVQNLVMIGDRGMITMLASRTSKRTPTSHESPRCATPTSSSLPRTTAPCR